MKKILLFLSFALAGGLFNGLQAQCDLQNPAVKLNYQYADGNGNCVIGLDLYFDMKHNPGGKYVWVHIWPTASYTNWNYATPPTLANGGLTGSVATVGLEHHQTLLNVLPEYPPDPSLPNVQYNNVTASEGPSILIDYELYAIKNLVLIIPGGCDVPQLFKFDIWESQAADAQKIHCFVAGGQFFANDPKVQGLLFCTNPRKYSFNIETINTTGSMDVSYKVFIDDGDGIFNKVNDTIKVNEGTATLSSSNAYKFVSGILDYTPYSEQKPYADRDLWVEVTSAAIPNDIYAQILNTCIPLPVKFSEFTARRNSDRVYLAWTTASEINNRGFYIMRQNGDKGWENIGYVASAALHGNSDAAIQYSFTDINKMGGISQYRLQQVDLDNTVTYSDIRMVKGMDQTGRLLVFPNPSTNGNLNIILDNMGTDLNVRLIDMNGRLVREWNRVTNGRIYVSQVASGMYTLRVWENNTGQLQQLKVIVSK
ncbi:MAG: T9SS type A sorting domain-containing protein [Chitinophagaceae bacterium]